MKAIRLTVVGLALIAAVVVFAQFAHAAEYLNTGNAAGSDNSIDATLQQSTNVNQSNTGSFSNDIDASADTGGNSVSGGNGGPINTGDATTDVNVDNRFNVNQANVTCCPEGTPTPTPKKPGPGQSPTPTLHGGVGGPPSGDGDGGGNGGGNGGGGGVGGGGEVIGLAAASGENLGELALTVSGILCLLAGAYLTRKNHLAI